MARGLGHVIEGNEENLEQGSHSFKLVNLRDAFYDLFQNFSCFACQ